MALLLPALALADSVWLMAIALVIFGGALGSLDVAMNVHAVEVERNAGRPMMSGFHALFSVGGFSGAALVTVMLSHSFAPSTATFVCSAMMVVAMALTTPRLLATATLHEGQSGTFMALPRGPVVILSVLAAITFLVEGALLDWSALPVSYTHLDVYKRQAVGWGAADSRFRSPMAVAVIGGLMTSTVLSLLVITAVFTVVDDFGGWVRRRLGRGVVVQV